MRLRIVSSPQQPAHYPSSEASPLLSSEDSPHVVAMEHSWPGGSLDLDSHNSSPRDSGEGAFLPAGLNRDTSLSSFCVSDGDDGALSLLPPRSPEAEARLQELLSDPCVTSLSETGVQCALCKKWYKVGVEWKHTRIWTRHKRVCPVKKQRSVLGRPPHIPVEIMHHIVDEDDGDGNHSADPRIRDSTYFDYQCDLCCRWVKKAQWEAHLSTACNRPRTAKGWVYLEEDSASQPSDSNPATLHPAPASPPAAPVPSSSETAALRIRLPPATSYPRPVGSFDTVSDDDEEVDYANMYSRYLVPGPAPAYSFRHAATPASAKRLGPAVFPSETDDEDDDVDAAARRAREVDDIDVNVLLEGTTSRFLRPRRRSTCCLDGPAGAHSEQTPLFPETVGMSVRQLVEAGLEPLTF